MTVALMTVVVMYMRMVMQIGRVDVPMVPMVSFVVLVVTELVVGCEWALGKNADWWNRDR